MRVSEPVSEDSVSTSGRSDDDDSASAESGLNSQSMDTGSSSDSDLQEGQVGCKAASANRELHSADIRPKAKLAHRS